MSRDAVAALADALERLPRLRLGDVPTPLQPAPRFSARLAALAGAGVEVWLKRDDLLGPAFGGNKVRKLELLLGDALAQGADCVITTGAAQSNHARLTAACARLVGLEPYLVLRGAPDSPVQGNLLLDHLLGAHVELVAVRRTAETWPAMEALAARLRSGGRRPYLIPVGGSVPLGAAAYAGAMLELDAQLAAAGLQPHAVFHASSSSGTQAGLALGAAALARIGRDRRVAGVDVDGEPDALERSVAGLARETAARLGLPDELLPDPASHVSVLGGYAGPGYGRVSEAGREAIRLLAETEGVFADPVYSGKALAGLLGEVCSGRVPAGSQMVFWHTGGTPALFAYADALV
jgi:D-cysteine desulfhydrase